MSVPPSGAVTFLFTDIEGSTAAWESRPVEMAADLETHDRVIRDAMGAHDGYVFATGLASGRASRHRRRAQRSRQGGPHRGSLR